MLKLSPTSSSSLGSIVRSELKYQVCFFNTGYSRARPDPPRPRDRAKSHPHSSPRDPRRKNGHRLQTRRARTFNTVGFPEAANDLSFSFGSAVERSIVVNQSSVWSLAYRRVLHLFYLFAPFLPTLKPIRFVAAGLPGSPPH